MNKEHEALLYDRQPGSIAACHLCGHQCAVRPGKTGVCGVRYNTGGTLYTHNYGNVIAMHVDPIEKKPLYHFLPGSSSFSIALPGCNFRCSFCQNWQISQVKQLVAAAEMIEPRMIVEGALKQRCKSISYTYTEPTIFFEYAYDTAKLARSKGLYNIFVTNGYMTTDAIEMIQPYLDAANVDLKGFSDEFYRAECGARLEPVLASIRRMHELKIWVEVTTLVIPGRNDSPGELKKIAEFIAGVGAEIPWHISRFHPDYQLTDAGVTPEETLRQAYAIGKKAGLKYVYMGNVLEDADTVCSSCGEVLITRQGFTVTANKVGNSSCLRCGARIDGVF